MKTDHNCIATKNIQNAIRQAGADLKVAHPILRHQNAIGLIIGLIAFIGMIASGLGYIYGFIPAWLCILCSAFFAAISHELEHDLIHRLYFRKQPLIQNMMMAIVWIMRPNTINPWFRRQLHFNHHKVSGTQNDVEERILGNGMTFGIKRIVASLDGFLSITIRIKELSSMKGYQYLSFAFKGAPLTHIYVVSLYGYLTFLTFDLFNLNTLLGFEYTSWFLDVLNWVEVMLVVWIIPNALRAFCLHNMTAALHYYGDVDSLLKQCQIMNHWSLLPLQLFCCNFGATHAIHHFVVSQPFYLRQMVAKKVYPVLQENGVRFNDFESVLRANRFAKKPEALTPQA
ncbi:fatty acid desaturase [Oceaniserpentilla sp. 4NH20-0058]|uniref:fatty acid desaturase n=1 Tax=Oceaniserpentilla sp. 4NH20-0058 TaxID=3127660 RepID=UPI00333EBFEC